MEKQAENRSQFNRKRILFLARVAMLSAVAVILYFLDFPLPFFLVFLKLDFSDIPAMVGGFALGPLTGVAVQLVKNLIHLLRSETMGVGELANFIIGTAFVLPAALIYRIRRNNLSAGIGLTAGALSMTAVGVIMNYFVTLPFYMTLFHITDEILFGMSNALVTFTEVKSLWHVVLLCITPFNLFKSVVIAIPSFLLHKYLGKYLKG